MSIKDEKLAEDFESLKKAINETASLDTRVLGECILIGSLIIAGAIEQAHTPFHERKT